MKLTTNLPDKEEEAMVRCEAIIDELFPGARLTMIVNDGESPVLLSNDQEAIGVMQDTIDAYMDGSGDHYEYQGTVQ